MFKTLISGRTEFRDEATLSAAVFKAVFKLNLSVLASRQQHPVTSAHGLSTGSLCVVDSMLPEKCPNWHQG